jgi:hypothetical protein
VGRTAHRGHNALVVYPSGWRTFLQLDGVVMDVEPKQ